MTDEQGTASDLIARFTSDTSNPIKCLADLQAIPCYEPIVDFGKASGRSLKDVLTEYEVAKIDEVPCGIQGCRQRHMHGYVVFTSDAKITNIGKDCGKKHLGLEFTQARKSFKVRRKAADNRKAVAKSFDELHVHQSKIDHLLKLSRALGRCKKVLREWSPAINAKLVRMAEIRSSQIVVERRMSKRDAQVHYLQTNTSRKDYERGRPMVEEKVGTLDGLPFFRTSLAALMGKSVTPAIDRLKALSEQEIRDLQPREVEGLSRDLGNAIRSLREAEQLADQGLRFFTPENVSKLAHMGATEQSLIGLVQAISELDAFRAP